MATQYSGSFTLQQQMQATAAGNWPVLYDPNFEYNTLLLNGDGTNGAQNNTFLDSSTNNFTITRNGNTTQGSFSPYGSNWGWYFDGSSVLSTSYTNQIVPVGTQDFTVEGWFFLTASISSEKNIMDNNAAAGGFNWYYDGTTYGVYANSVGSIVSTSYTIATNQWVHLAITRSGNTFTLYVNGTSIHSGTSSQSFASQGSGGAGNPTIMGRSSSNRITGYMSNMRVVLGSVVYTGNFTPSTTPLTAVSGTALLLQANRFIDNSSNAYALIIGGSPLVQRFSPFNPTAPYSTSVIGGSGYFDGSGDDLRTASNVSLGTTYTFEAWVNYSSLATGTNAENSIFGSGVAGGIDFGYGGSNGNKWFMAIYGSGFAVQSADTTIQKGVWYHVAWVLSGGTGTIYVNGTSVASGAYSPSSPPTTNIYVGSYGGGGYTNGYISDARYVNGTAVYTSNFTPPTAPLTAITNTALLCSMTNAGIPDLAMQNNLETVGNAQVSTSVKKYGTGSLAFDGTGDWLTTSPNQVLNFKTGNFTIEGWVYTTNTSTTLVFSQWNTGAARDGVSIGWFSSTKFWWLFGDGSSWIFERQVTSTVPTNTWFYMTVVRDNGTARFYIDGVQIDSIANTTNLNQQTSNVSYVGGNPNGYTLTGNMDDFRITNGLCRYPNGTTFTPPTAALPTF